MILGLIGGAGSGKSAVAKLLQNENGFLVLQTDHIAKQMMNENAELKEKLRQAFGTDIYDSNGVLDRKRYAELIYSNPENRKRSDAIVHPAVWEETSRLIRENSDRNTVIETALPNAKLNDLCDHVIYVQSDPEIRIRRMIQNRNYSETYARSILQNQPSDETYLEHSDKLLQNNEGKSELRDAVNRMVKEMEKA